MESETFPSLRTPRLWLRRFQDLDAAAFAGYRSDPEVARYQGWEAPFSLEEATRFVSAMASAQADVSGEWFQIAVALRGDAALIGDIAFHPDPDEPRSVEIGFTIARQHQGQGYASEALRELLRYLFVQRRKHRVAASCDPRNVSSTRVLKRLGMRQEGHLMESTWSKGEWTDDLLFAILQREWVG